MGRQRNLGTLAVEAVPQGTFVERIRAEVVILRAEKADKMGNLMFRHTSRNYNTVIPAAADFVAVEVPEEGIVEVGELADCEVMVPGVFVDLIAPIPKGCAFYER